jgi:hypothetical protein
MKSKLTCLSFLLFTSVVVGCRTAPTASTPREASLEEPPKKFTVKVAGAPGLVFTGTLTADGGERRVSGVTPATFELSGYRIKCALAKRTAEGPFSAEVWQGNRYLGKAITRSASGSVCAEILSFGSVETRTFSPDDPDEAARTLAPFHPATANSP